MAPVVLAARVAISLAALVNVYGPAPRSSSPGALRGAVWVTAAAALRVMLPTVPAVVETAASMLMVAALIVRLPVLPAVPSVNGPLTVTVPVLPPLPLMVRAALKSTGGAAAETVTVSAAVPSLIVSVLVGVVKVVVSKLALVLR